jgi:hypothetical protein
MTSLLRHACSAAQVEAMTPSRKHSSFLLAEAMGNAQHHDGVSGTEQQAVAEDYARSVCMPPGLEAHEGGRK